MFTAALSARLTSGTVPLVVDILAAIAFFAMLATRRWRRWLPIAAIVIAAGFGLGLLCCWVLSDLLNLFGVALSTVDRVWVGVALAGLSLGIARAIFSGPRFIAVGALAAVAMALAGALGLNSDLAEFPTVGNLFAVQPYHRLDLTPDPSMPLDGRIGYVRIPDTSSHFRARDALVYLPPAALVAHASRLPVVVMLSGQPGGPSDLFVKGGLGAYLNDWARAHSGRAPIIVVPDQLGQPSRNPMCVNSPLGNVATYLTVDVPRWIRQTLPVLPGPANWGIGGFSEGGTCAIQFGSSDPALFGSILDVSGEIAPIQGSLKQTIDSAFGGSTAAYRAASPVVQLAKHSPYAHSFALFAVGAGDTRYGPGLRTIHDDAVAAGMDTRLYVSPGSAHDWRTVHYAFEQMIPALAEHWKLDG